MGGGIEDANKEYYCSLTKQLMITRDACRYYATHLRAQQHRFEETEFCVLINNRKGMLKEDKKGIPPPFRHSAKQTRTRNGEERKI